MRMADFLRIMAPALKMLSRRGLFLDDWKYVEAYEQYRHMRSLGVKQREAVRILAEETKVSHRTLERAFRRLAGEC